MDDVAAFSVTAAASAAAVVSIDSGLDDFGLIDYESPGPDPLPDMEEPEELEEEEEEAKEEGEESNAANGLIDYEESDDDNDEADTSIAAPTAFDVSDEHRMDFDDDAERLEQSLHDSHLGSAGEQEPVVTDTGLDDEALVRALMEEDVSEHGVEEAEATVAATYSEQ
ncbi:hypothetical protein GGI19_002604, partial [Coemansia pectinata]